MLEACTLQRDLAFHTGYACYFPPSDEEERLEALVKRHCNLVDMRRAEKNRLHQVHESLMQNIGDHIAHLDKLIADLEKQIEHFSNQVFAGKSEVILAEQGIGCKTCATLLSILPEPGRVSHKRIAMLVGVVPPSDQSGESRKKPGCTGDRMAVRNVLYMAALAATRYHPKIKAFYQRLHGEKHKPAKVALNACMHKLLRILNAKVRDYLNSEEVSSLKCA